MDGSADTIAEETLFALETRLRRIEFILAGSSEDPIGELYALRKSGKESSVKSRLNALERDLSRLATKSRTVKDMLDLRLSPRSPLTVCLHTLINSLIQTGTFPKYSKTSIQRCKPQASPPKRNCPPSYRPPRLSMLPHHN